MKRLLVTATLLAAAPVGAQTLLQDHCDSLKTWTAVDGAQVGDGPRSTATVDDGAIRLEANRDTRRWVALERTVALNGARWIRVSARLRSDGVDPSNARYTNADLFALFPGAPVVATRIMLGTQPWTAVRRSVPVPAGASSVTVGCFLSMPGRLWCDDVTVEAFTPRFAELAHGHFVYRVFGGSIEAPHVTFNEESYRIVSELFGPREKPILFVKYPDRETKEEFTGDAGNGITLGDEIHTIWPTDRHEIVHVFARAWGDPPPLLGEGLAVHVSGAWQGKPVDESARGVLDRWVPLGVLLDPAEFRRHDDAITYAIAGAFVGWIIRHHGMEKLRALYGALHIGAPLGANRLQLATVLGRNLDDIDKLLRSELSAKK